MKKSNYTSFLRIEGDYILVYNSLADKFLVLDSTDYPVNDITELINHADTDKTLYDKLVKSGCLIDDDVDEEKMIRTIMKDTDNNPELFQLHINPTLDCNLRCWYCYETHKTGSLMSENTVESVKRFIERTIRETPDLKYFNISLFGGEPMIGFAKVVRPILDFARELCAEKDIKLLVQATTNGVLFNKPMIEYMSAFSPSFQITLDGGRKSHDQSRIRKDGTGTFDRILGNIREMLANGINVIIRVNFTSESIGEVNEIIYSLEDLPKEQKMLLMFDLQQVWQDHDVTKSNSELESRIEEKVRNLEREMRDMDITCMPFSVMNGIHNSCYADKTNYLLINYDGLVYRCTARDFNRENAIGELLEDGTVKYDMPRLELRMNSKFSKEICCNCRIAPICTGGCGQKAMEHISNPECNMAFTEEDKDKAILTRFENYVIGSHRYSTGC